MSRFYWIFGLISGIVYLVLDYTYKTGIIGYEKVAAIFFSQIGIFVISIVFASVAYKKVHGEISFMRTVFGAVMVGLISSIVIISGEAIFTSDETYNDASKNYEFEMLYEGTPVEERTEEWVKQKQEELDAEYSFGNLVIVTLMTYLVFGAIIGALTAAFISNRESLRIQ